MNLTDQNKIFYYSVYSIVERIPYGKVTSYGHIAYLLGRPENSRMVGSALKHSNIIIDMLQEDLVEEGAHFHNLPWWRVLLSVGKISPRGNSRGEYKQAQHLRDEGVLVLESHKVDLNVYGWFPDTVEI